MLTLTSSHYRSYTSLFIRIWLAEKIDTFSTSINSLMTNSAVNNLDFLTKCLMRDIDEAKLLPPAVALKLFYKFKKRRKIYEEYEEFLSNSKNNRLRYSIKLLVKAAYKYEARLHTVGFSDKPVMKTPDYIKEGLSDIGRESVKAYFESRNALQ